MADLDASEGRKWRDRALDLCQGGQNGGLKIITWSLKRSGPLKSDGGYHYQSVKDVIDSDGMIYEVVDALAQGVGVSAIFSDWPATVTFYANCMGLK